MSYALIRPLLFSFDPETSHHLTLNFIHFLNKVGILSAFVAKNTLTCPEDLLGLTFKNRIGLAAGLDKNGDYIDALGKLGFGFIEVGTVTPVPQAGNPKPRLFRLEQQQGLINRMGFNNKGVDYLVTKVQQKKYQGILGINIGKNLVTPLENAVDDYLICLRKVYPYADYITINISSPNTPGLRSLQDTSYLDGLLTALRNEQRKLGEQYQREVPLLVKVSPDLKDDDILLMANLFKEQGIRGVIVTNTNIGREGLERCTYQEEQGGLSGAPLFNLSTKILSQFKAALNGSNITLIACGGVMSGEQAAAKIKAGADLVQLYTGLIYEGPRLIKDAIEKTCSLIIG